MASDSESETVGLETETSKEKSVPGKIADGKGREVFPVIGKHKSGTRRRLQSTFPKWFQNYIPFGKDFNQGKLSLDDSVFSLDPKVTAVCEKKLGFFFPVQQAAIPVILDSLRCNDFYRGFDVCVSSPTGSGKTLAFVIPIVEFLVNRVDIRLRALILLPVRDLACQVFKVLEGFTKPTGLKAALSVGQSSFKADCNSLIKEIGAGEFRWACDILVTTPSRLIDLIHSCPGFNLSSLKILVLDEADRIIDFDVEYNWLKEIDNAVYGRNSRVPCPCCIISEESPSSQSTRACVSYLSGCSFTNYRSSCQTYIKLIFSATLSKDVDKLFLLNLFKPKLLMATDLQDQPTNSKAVLVNGGRPEVTKSIIPDELTEKFIIVPSMNKPLVILHLIETLKYRRVLCFTRTHKQSHLLTELLNSQGKAKVCQFSSKMTDKDRAKALENFKKGEIDVIIATDIMTRGMDIENVDFVISYDVPFDDIHYVHRIGRTARAGRPGTAITILTLDQTKRFHILIRKVHPKDQIRSKLTKMNIETKKLNIFKSSCRNILKQIQQKIKTSEWQQEKRNKSMAWKGMDRVPASASLRSKRPKIQSQSS